MHQHIVLIANFANKSKNIDLKHKHNEIETNK